MSLIVTITLLKSAFALSVPAADKTQCFDHVSFYYNLQLINGISSGLQKLFRYFNGTAIILFFRIPLVLFGAVWAAAFPKNLDLSMKGLTAMDLGVGVLKGRAHPLNFEQQNFFFVIFINY